MGATRFSISTQRHRLGGNPVKGRPATLADIPLEPGPTQHLHVVGVDFGQTAVFRTAASAGVASLPGQPDAQDSIICTFIVSGHPVATCAETVHSAKPGTAWVHKRSSSVEIRWPGEGVLVGAVLPGRVLNELGLAIGTSLTDLSERSSLIGPTQQFISGIATGETPIPSIAAHYMKNLIHEMVGGMLLEDSGVVLTEGPNRPSIYDQAMSTIASRVSDAALSPDVVARELNVSLRHLQRDFEKRGTSVAKELRQARVDLALRLLLSEGNGAALSLEEIAVRSGFASLGHLRRTLKAAGHSAPSYLRAATSSNGSKA